MNQKQVVLDLLKKHKLTVISTVNQSKPESAVIEFGQTQDLEIIFDTLRTSRKYENLQTNEKVALVIGWDENITVQYEGVAKRINQEDLPKYQKLFYAKNPDAEKWKDNPEIAFFKVKPKWIRYSDLNKQPWEVFEIVL